MNKNKEITIEVKNPELILLLLFLSIILILELNVTFSTKISFGDEGFHTRMAQWIAQNVEYPVWIPFTQTAVSKSGFVRPPFWNILEAGFFYVLGFHESIVKFLTPMIAMLTGIAVYLFAKRFYNERVGFIAAVILVTVPSFVTYSVLFYTDVLITFLVVMFMFMFALSVKTGRRLYMLCAGTFGGLAYMTKLTGYVVYAFVLLIFLYYFVKEKKFFSLIKKYSPMFLMLILIPTTFFIRNYRYYGTPICSAPPLFGVIFKKFFDLSGCNISDFESQYEFAGRIEEVSSEASVFKMGIANYLEFAYGNIWFVVFAFFAGLFLIFNKKISKKISKLNEVDRIDTILLIILLLYAPIFLISTRRAEDTARYALIWVPIISIISARYFEDVYNFIKNYQRHIALVIFVIVLYFSYQNAAPKLAVMTQVKQFSPSFFEACNWVKENLPENSILFTVWSHRTAYSCQRNVVGNFPDISVSRDLNYTLSIAKQNGITHIFIQKFSIDYQNRHLQEKYDWDFVQFLESNPENFVNVYENGPSLDQCRQQGGCDGNIIYEIKY